MDRCEFIFLNAFEYLCMCVCVYVCVWHRVPSRAATCVEVIYMIIVKVQRLCCLCGSDA